MYDFLYMGFWFHSVVIICVGFVLRLSCFCIWDLEMDYSYYLYIGVWFCLCISFVICKKYVALGLVRVKCFRLMS